MFAHREREKEIKGLTVQTSVFVALDNARGLAIVPVCSQRERKKSFCKKIIYIGRNKLITVVTILGK